MVELPEVEEFDWDDANAEKNWEEHAVRRDECEQVFFNRPVVVHADVEHSEKEERFFLLGKTDASRKLFVVFTVRKTRIRVISARDMAKKERTAYLEHAS